MTVIERYKEAKRNYDKCQEEYSLCLNYAVMARHNRDDAELKMRLAKCALAEQRGFTTEKEVDDFVADPLGLQKKLEEK